MEGNVRLIDEHEAIKQIEDTFIGTSNIMRDIRAGAFAAIINCRTMGNGKRGEWVQVICHVEYEDGFVDRLYECCSLCHMPNGHERTDYCPNCGARMDGEA